MTGLCSHCGRQGMSLVPTSDGRRICAGQWYECHNYYLRNIVPQQYRRQVREGIIRPGEPRKVPK